MSVLGRHGGDGHYVQPSTMGRKANQAGTGQTRSQESRALTKPFYLNGFS
jgi:hypothetical protein